MRLSATRLRRAGRTEERARAVPIVVASLLLAATGCVTASSHREVVAERDRLTRQKSDLEQQLDRLQRSNASLNAERLNLFEELEDLRSVRAELDAEVSDLRESKELLSESLAARQMDLVAEREEVQRLGGTYAGLVSDLEAEVAAGRIEIEQLRGALQVNVSDEILFASGSAALNAEGLEVLSKVARQLASSKHTIEVRGHTDNTPIRGALRERYPTNWELAGARSASVVRLFQESGIEGSRLTSVSKAEFDPVAPNETAEDRWLNRRIEIVLLPVREEQEKAGDVGSGPGEP